MANLDTLNRDRDLKRLLTLVVTQSDRINKLGSELERLRNLMRDISESQKGRELLGEKPELIPPDVLHPIKHAQLS